MVAAGRPCLARLMVDFPHPPTSKTCFTRCMQRNGIFSFESERLLLEPLDPPEVFRASTFGCQESEYLPPVDCRQDARGTGTDSTPMDSGTEKKLATRAKEQIYLRSWEESVKEVLLFHAVKKDLSQLPVLESKSQRNCSRCSTRT